MSENNNDNSLIKTSESTIELGFYKNKAKYYEKSLEDLMQHCIDGCSMCTSDLDCSECAVDDFINQLRDVLYGSKETR